VIFAVLATGPSMSQAVADSVRHLRCIAVSDAYQLAPWAEAMVSIDMRWWRVHPEAMKFAGRKFTGDHDDAGELEKVRIAPGMNSGVLGIRVARLLGAEEIILLGFDGHGTHYFGPHPEPLKNTTELRRQVHMDQHRQMHSDCCYAGVKIWNCTPGTAITSYPKAELAEVLCAHGSTCATP
jgi:predicted peroxiredoxin